MKILFLTNLLPYPLDNGGKIKTYTTIKSLSESKHEIDLVCFNESSDINMEYKAVLLKECSEIYHIYLKLTTVLHKTYMMRIALKSLFSSYSFGLLKYISEDMVMLLNKLAKDKVYDCVYFDHLQMFVYAKQIYDNWPNAKYILDEHNCEFMIMKRNADNSTNLLKKWFLNVEASKLKKFESKSLRKVNRVIVLSPDDDKKLKEISSETIPTTIIPIGMKMPDMILKDKFDDLDTVNILYVGTLSWVPNHDGLVWYLENVMPKMWKEYGDFKLFIVGKNPGDELLKLAQRYPNIEITGYVDSVIPYYQKCDFMIVPLFIGSGQRVKIIEGFSYGIPIISTSIGAEGLNYTDGENLLIANTTEEFVDAAKKMKYGRIREKLSKKSREIFNEFYSLDAVKDKIIKVVSQ